MTILEWAGRIRDGAARRAMTVWARWKTPAYQLKSPDWYIVKYNIVVQYRVKGDRIADCIAKASHESQSSASVDALQREHREALECAADHARELILTAARAMRRLGPVPQSGRKQMRTFLGRTVEPATAVTLAGILLAAADFTGSSTPGRRSAPLRRRGKLMRTLRSETRFAQLRPAQLIEYAQRKERKNHLTYRVHYNLACYFSTTAGKLNGDVEHQALFAAACPLDRPSRGSGGDSPPAPSVEENVLRLTERAYTQLTTAIRRAPRGKREELATWAQDDPTLEVLRVQQDEKFKALTQEWATHRLQHVGRSRPALEPLLEAREQNGWSIDAVLELWGYALQADPRAQAKLRKPEDWDGLLKLMELAEQTP